MGVKWSEPLPAAMGRMYDRKTIAIYGSLLQLVLDFQFRIEDWMKDSAVWEDQTGNARQGLAVDVLPELTKITLLLTIGRHPDGGFLSYGKHLERSRGGDYAIIGPAVDHWAPQVYSAARQVLR